MYQERSDAEERRRAEAEEREERAERRRIEAEERAERERRAEAERRAAAEAERRAAAEAERRAAAEHAAYVADRRAALNTDFKDGKIPLAVDNVTADELWYFAWQSSGSQVTVTGVFPIARYGDGSYPFKNTVVSEISKAGVAGSVKLTGWYGSSDEAQRAKNRFLQTARDAEMTVKEVTYKGKPKNASGTQTGDDFWGTKPAAQPAQKSATTKKDSFWD
jgi:hypothetical protein